MAVKALLDPLNSQVKSLWGDVSLTAWRVIQVRRAQLVGGSRTLVIVMYWAAPYKFWSHS